MRVGWCDGEILVRQLPHPLHHGPPTRMSRRDRTVLNGSMFFSSGFCATTAGTRSRHYTTCIYIGCSTRNVPSGSKVAMRASGVTKVGLERSVVSRTKDMIACFAAPSFQDGSGSADWASAGVGRKGAGRTGSAANPESTERRLMVDACIRLHVTPFTRG
jgi:hypothetical protein